MANWIPLSEFPYKNDLVRCDPPAARRVGTREPSRKVPRRRDRCEPPLEGIQVRSYPTPLEQTSGPYLVPNGSMQSQSIFRLCLRDLKPPDSASRRYGENSIVISQRSAHGIPRSCLRARPIWRVRRSSAERNAMIMPPTPKLAPQPVAAPLTRAAIFLVVTVNPGAAAETAVRALCADLAGPVALGRVSRARRTPVLHHGVRVGRVGSPVRSAAAGRTASVPGNRRRPAPRRRHAGRPAVPYSRRADGSVFRAGDARS